MTNHNPPRWEFSVCRSCTQPSDVDVSDDRRHEGTETLRLDGPVIGEERILMRNLQMRLANMADDKDGPEYRITLRLMGLSPPDMMDGGVVRFSGTIRVPRTIYAKDLKKIIAEIHGVEPS